MHLFRLSYLFGWASIDIYYIYIIYIYPTISTTESGVYTSSVNQPLQPATTLPLPHSSRIYTPVPAFSRLAFPAFSSTLWRFFLTLN